MERTSINDLLAWKESKKRKPLILTGARQVGKTWLMKEFGKKYFKNVAYLSFDKNRNLDELFESTISPKLLLPILQAETSTTITPETLIIFDEIQEVPRALMSLKYFNEEAPEYAIIAAGSSLGVTLHSGQSFPVGKVDFLHLHPMTFLEFLDSIGESHLKDLIVADRIDQMKVFHERLGTHLREYLFIGGMPEVVDDYAQNRSFDSARKIQNQILYSYDNDFSKYATEPFSSRLRLLWNSLDSQLAKENKKFVYNAVRQGARARDFEAAIQWLEDSSLVAKLYNVSTPLIPLKSYRDFDIFKLFMHDVGLLGAMANVMPSIIANKDAVFREFKGALAEQYVYQQLLATNKMKPYYWTPERGTAEVDFIFEDGDSNVIPLEVKSGGNIQAKSLGIFIDKYHPKQAFRCSIREYNKGGIITDIPLYAVSVIPELCHLD